MSINYSEMYNIIPTIFKKSIHKGSCFHYTSIQGFLLMMEDIQKRKCYIFPGHMRYQNDIQELSEGVSFVKQNISKITENKTTKRVLQNLNELNNNIYISCFSSDGDLLEQWKYYGSNCGLSIEFNFEQCEGFFNGDQISAESIELFEYSLSPDSCNKSTTSKYNSQLCFEKAIQKISKSTSDYTRGGISLNPIDVLYSDEQKHDIMKNMLNENLDTNMGELSLYRTDVNKKLYEDYAISAFVPVCKNHYFEHERESRLLFFPSKDIKIKYREKSNRILPYLKCTVVNKDANKYPILSVTVGPGNNQNLIFNAVINILEGNDNIKFFSEDNEQEIIMNQYKTYDNLEKLKNHISYGEFCCYKKQNNENIIVYCSTTGILIYKSAIPFRD